MTMRLVGHLAGNRTQEIPPTTKLKLNEDLTVEIRWATPHMITIREGETEVHSVNITWTVD